MPDKRFSRFSFLVTEFVVIVLGVLVALAVDEWRDKRSDARLERYFLEGLSADLQRDSADLTNFARRQAKRASAADHVLYAAHHPLADTLGARASLADDLTPARAFSTLGRTNHIEPTRSSFNTMINSGGIAVISDPELRRRIVNYYARVDDYIDINEYNERDLEVYRRRLEQFGQTPFDGSSIDTSKLLGDGTVLASARHMRSLAHLGEKYGNELAEMAIALRRDISGRIGE